MAWRGRGAVEHRLRYRSQRIPEKLEKYFVLVVVVWEIVVDLQYWNDETRRFVESSSENLCRVHHEGVANQRDG